MTSQASELHKAVELHRAGQFTQAQQIYLQLLQNNPQQTEVLHLLGLSYLDAGDPIEAVRRIERAIEIEPANAGYHLDLGLAHKALGHLTAALSHFEQALRLHPNYVSAHLNLGITFMEQGKLSEAQAQFHTALAVEPRSAMGWNNLANLYITSGNLEQAKNCLQQAIQIEPGYAEAHNGLGSVWHRLGELQRARDCFERAIACRANYATAHYNLGVALQATGQMDHAQMSFQRAVQFRPNFVEAFYQWAVVLKSREQFSEAQDCLERALRLRPEYAPALDLLSICLEFQGKSREARAALDRLLALQPADEVKLRSALLLPVIYESKNQIRAERVRLEHAIEVLSQTPLHVVEPDKLTGVPFFLAYQGLDESGLMKRLASIYHHAIPDLGFVAPHCRPYGQRRELSHPIRVGFVSRFFFRHTIGKLNAGLIRSLPRELFEIVLCTCTSHDDEMSQALEASAERTIKLPQNLDLARQHIAEQQLDALIYTDIGMDPRTYFLAFARLAPVQCVTWGHPVTSGIPTIDYFISSEHLEPDGAERFYSERLVRLPHLNTCYAEPHVVGERKTRREFCFPEGAHVYLCTQSLYKVHPDMDQVFETILREDPDSLVILLSGPQPHWKELLWNRLCQSIPHTIRRILFLEQQSQADFVHLQAAADVLLDSFPFGGGNTSLEALAFGTPIVTLSGPMLHGRITYACYRQMGINACVARDVEEYIRIALRLGTDRAFRADVRSQILERKHLLYNNQAAVDELSEFLGQAVMQSRTEQGHAQ